MATFVKAFLKDHFDARDAKEKQFSYLTNECAYDKERVSEVLWGDKKAYTKEETFKHGAISEDEWYEAMELARTEFGDEIVDAAQDTFEGEKKKEEDAGKENEEFAKKMEEHEKDTVYTRLEAGRYENMVAGLLPRLVKCNDQTQVLVHIPDADMAKDARLECIYIKCGDEVVAIKKFTGEADEKPEFWWEADSWGAKMTPYAYFGKYGLWKGDKVNEPWSAELHEDPDADDKEMKKLFDEMNGKAFTITEAPIEPHEEWLSEDPAYAAEAA